MDMKAEILKILNNNSNKVDLLGTNEESIQAIDGERIIDTEDIKIITDELIKLFSLHLVSQQREPLKAFLTWFDADLSYLKDHNELIDDYFNSL